MIAFRIQINGKPYCETEDVTALTLVAEALQSRKQPRISLHASAGEGSLQWLAANLSVGDEIFVQIVEAAESANSLSVGCNFCGKETHGVNNILQGQSAAICDRCIAGFGAAVTSGKQLPIGAVIRDEAHWVCDFCEKQPGTIPGVIVRNGAAICPECLHACADILSEGAGEESSNEA